MTPRILSCALLVLLACAPGASASADDTSGASSSAKARDFSWSGTVKKGGAVQLSNVSGDVEVVASEGDSIRVRAEISGRDADLAKVVIDHEGKGVKIHTELARKRNVDVRVDYRIELPAGADFEAHVVSGNIEAQGIRGALELEAVSGNVTASGSGDVHVQTVSGNAKVSLPAGTRRAMLEAVSGELELVVPAALGLDLVAKTLSGRVDSEVKHERRTQLVGDEVRIASGDRAATIRLETVSGGIAVRKG